MFSLFASADQQTDVGTVADHKDMITCCGRPDEYRIEAVILISGFVGGIIFVKREVR